MKDETQNVGFIILAAGNGNRMHSTMPKVMHEITGKPMLFHVIDTALSCKPQKVVVVTSPNEHLQNGVKKYQGKIQNIVLPDSKGTADSTQAGAESFKNFNGNIVIIFGDTPFIRRNTILSMLRKLRTSPNMGLVVLGMEVHMPNAYGKLITDIHGNVKQLIEPNTLTENEKNLTLCNSGVMVVRRGLLPTLLSRLENTSGKTEKKIDQLVGLAREQGYGCGLVTTTFQEGMGVNTLAELLVARKIAGEQLQKRL